MYVTYISYREPLEERPRSPEDPADVFVSLDGNLVTRVFWLFGQRVNAREDSGGGRLGTSINSKMFLIGYSFPN